MVTDDLQPQLDDPDTAEGRAQAGWQQVGETAPVQHALDFGGNIDRYGDMVSAAVHGDPDAQKALSQYAMGIAAGTLKIPEEIPEEIAAKAKKMGFDPEKIYYHGTPGGQFKEFQYTNHPGVAGFFTPEQEFARKFAEDPNYSSWIIPEGNENPFIHKVLLKTKKTFDYDNPSHLEDLSDFYKSKFDDLSLLKQREMISNGISSKNAYAKQQIDLLKDASKNGSNWKNLEDPELIGYLKDKGFDSMHVAEEGQKNIAVFKPNQIRWTSAKFNPENANSGNLAAGLGGVAALGAGAALMSGNEAQAAEPQQPQKNFGISQPKLFDPTTGAPLAIDPDQIPDAVKLGKASFLKGDSIPVINPAGRAVTIPAEEAKDAFARGYKYEPPAAQQERMLQSAYGEGFPNEAKAFAAGAARGATLGLSDVALTRSGLVNPETLAELEKRNPTASLSGSVAGIAAPALLTGGASTEAAAAARGIAPSLAKYVPSVAAGELGSNVAVSVARRLGVRTAEEAAELGTAIGSPEAQGLAQRIVRTAIPAAAGSAVEGALYGVGNTVSEQALGDPDVNAEKLASNVGLGALIGMGIGGGLGTAEAGLAHWLGKTGEHTAGVGTDALREAIRTGATPGGEEAPFTFLNPVEQMQKLVPPDSLEAIAQQVKGAKYQGLTAEMPQKAVLQNAAANVNPEMAFPVGREQIESLDNPQIRDVYKTILESQTEEGKLLQQREALQKAELVNKANALIRGISPEGKVTAEAAQNGEKAIRAFTDQYEAEKQALKPLFERFDGAAIKEVSNPQELIGSIEEAIPGAGDYIRQTPEGYQLEPFSSKMPMSRNAYDAVKDVLDAANSPDLKIGELRNTREAMRDRLNLLSSPRDQLQIGGLRKSLMDYIESQVAKLEPDLGVRETFKRYAINELERGVIEKLFGGSISDKAAFAKQIKPENVLDRVFGNTINVKAAQQILGPKFDQLLADHLAEQAARVTDKGAFSSNKFATYLKNNADALKVAFQKAPEKLERLHNYADIMRILPDSPSVNPSGTAKAKTILELVSKLGNLISNPKESVGGAIKGMGAKFEHSLNVQQLKNAMQGVNPNEAQAVGFKNKILTLRNIEQTARDTTDKIKSGVSAFIRGAADTVAVPASVNYLESNRINSSKSDRSKADRYAQFEKRADELSKLAGNPSLLTENISDNLENLSHAAPNTAKSLSMTAANGAQFLYSKLPQDPLAQYAIAPGARKWRPSDTEISKFERYMTAVDNPMSVIQDMKHGILSSEGVETLRQVYPKIYGEITATLAQHIGEAKKDLSYPQRLQASLLFGIPIDASATPSFVANMQALHSQSSGQEQAKQNSGINRSGVSKMTTAQRTMSAAEKVANGGSENV